MLARVIYSRRKSSSNVLKQLFQLKCLPTTPSLVEKNYSSNSDFKPSSKTSAGSELKEKFESVAPELMNTITEIEYLKEIPRMKESFRKILTYNLFDGKKNRGLQTVITYQTISPQSNEEDLKLVCLMGWCVELLQAFYLVHDDIIDGSKLRRGRPCWYCLPENELNAINDGVLLENSIYVILQKYLQNKPYYVNIMECFHDVTMKTSVGQVLDTQISKGFQSERNFDRFTPECYFTIAKYKTAYYSFQLPVTIAMYAAGLTEKSHHEKATNILLDIGQYFQVQDDFLDCYGDKKKIGKSGTDIAEGKCTWLVVNALHLANPEQKRKLKENYGNSDPEKVQSIVQIYNSLGLPDEFEKYEKKFYDKLMFDVKNLPEGLPHEIFTKTLNNIYKRGH